MMNLTIQRYLISDYPISFLLVKETFRQIQYSKLRSKSQGIYSNNLLSLRILIQIIIQGKMTSHREGAGAVNNYLKHLVKNQNERYYIDYDNIADRNTSEMFKRIETRLRKFEK